MSTGTKGQQAIDTLRDIDHLLSEGFGTFWLIAKILLAATAVTWTVWALYTAPRRVREKRAQRERIKAARLKRRLAKAEGRKSNVTPMRRKSA